MEISRRQFGGLHNQGIIAITLTNDSGMSVTCLNYGCIISNIMVPDRQGKMENVVLGFDSIEDYEKYSPYFGAVVGRVAGRIKGAAFRLDEKEYKLAENENGNHIHGGRRGFSHVIWGSDPFEDEKGVGVIFTYDSPDGEEGYPGFLRLKVVYQLTKDNKFIISYEATTDQKTIVNLTNHSYFNLSGNLKRDVLNHHLTMKSSDFLELNSQLMPTGKLLDVSGSAFDFRQGRMLMDGTISDHPQNQLASNGYDHPFTLKDVNNRAIILYDQESGRKLRVETDQPCVVLYTSNQLGGDHFIRGVQARKYLGVCLETQGYPDAIHHSHFPSVVLDKGEVYQTTTSYHFSVE